MGKLELLDGMASRSWLSDRDALKIGEELNDLANIVLSNYWLAIYHTQNCEFNKALPLFKKILEFNTAANNLWGMSAVRSTMAWFLYSMQGKCELAYRTSREAVRVAGNRQKSREPAEGRTASVPASPGARGGGKGAARRAPFPTRES